MSTSVVTARLGNAELAALDALAAGMDRSRAWVVTKAINRYVEEEAAVLADIQKGVEDIEAGRVHTQDEVEAMFGIERDERNAA